MTITPSDARLLDVHRAVAIGLCELDRELEAAIAERGLDPDGAEVLRQFAARFGLRCSSVFLDHDDAGPR